MTNRNIFTVNYFLVIRGVVFLFKYYGYQGIFILFVVSNTINQ